MDVADLPVFRAAVQHLVDSARRERAMLPADSSERQFLLGVDAAALEALHPELGQTRGDGWLDAETIEFRDGYHRTRTALADAQRRDPVPVRIPIPSPDPHIVG